MNSPKHSPKDMRRLDTLKIEPLVKFPPNRWRALVKESEAKRKHYEKDTTTRPWSRWRELRGIAAEEVISVVTALPRHHAYSDGGEDFFKTDVKGVPPRRPVLAVVPIDKRGSKIRWSAPYFLCVVVDIDHHWGSILGWAHRDEVREARLIQMPNAKAHVLYPWELHPGIPPELETYAKMMKAIR